jgi:uncharacterized phiE125 gp8 family phage protein
MAIILHTPPNDLPLSVEDAKLHLRIDHVEEDDKIQSLIKSARNYVENAWDCALCPQTMRLTLDAFPSGMGIIELPRRPLLAVSSITYIDSSGDDVELDEDEYKVCIGGGAMHGRIVPSYGNHWPVARKELDAVTIEYDAGFATVDGEEYTANVPDDIKSALLLIIGHHYKERDQSITGTIAEIPMNAHDLLNAALGIRYA